MKKHPHPFYIFAILLLISSCYGQTNKKEIKKQNVQTTINIEKLKQHARLLKNFAQQQKASTKLGILVDMSIHSWKRRIFVINLETDSILLSGICAHGQGNDANREEVVFSNTPGSNCSSEGRYKLGGKYTGQYGQAYKLFGLDPNNSKAFERAIVFHYYPSVTDVEDSFATRSNGCPMVSPKFFAQAAKFIDASSKPVLMWIYK